MMIPSDLQDYGFEYMFGTWKKQTDVSAFYINADPSMHLLSKQITIYTNSKPYSGVSGGAYDLDKQYNVYRLETALKLAKLYGFV